MWNKKFPDLYQGDIREMERFFPNFKPLFSDDGRLDGWEGTVKPVPSHEDFILRINYSENYPQQMPKARVVSPDIFFLYYQGGRPNTHPHFNFDGTICPLFPPDKTWVAGKDSIAKYIGHCCVWLIGHLYWNEFGKWPLSEAPHEPRHLFYLMNGKDPCYCGSGKYYRDCHRKRDKKLI